MLIVTIHTKIYLSHKINNSFNKEWNRFFITSFERQEVRVCQIRKQTNHSAGKIWYSVQRLKRRISSSSYYYYIYIYIYFIKVHDMFLSSPKVFCNVLNQWKKVKWYGHVCLIQNDKNDGSRLVNDLLHFFVKSFFVEVTFDDSDVIFSMWHC